MDYTLPNWLGPQAALGWGELAGQAARARLNAGLERDRMAQQSAQFAIEANMRSQQLAQETKAHQDALNYQHMLDQQRIAIDQQYKQQQVGLREQAIQLASDRFQNQTQSAAQKYAATQAFQKAILPKEQGGEGLSSTEAALKYMAPYMTGDAMGKLAGNGAADEYSPGATIMIPGGGTMVNTGGKRWQVLPGVPQTVSQPPEPLEVKDDSGKVIGDVIQLPGQKPTYHPRTATKASPMDVLRQRQQQFDNKTPDKKAPIYKTKDDVVKAFKDGNLSRDEAAKLLNEQFGVPLK